jgi:hypothetical protein
MTVEEKAPKFGRNGQPAYWCSFLGMFSAEVMKEAETRHRRRGHLMRAKTQFKVHLEIRSHGSILHL